MWPGFEPRRWDWVSPSVVPTKEALGVYEEKVEMHYL